MVAEGCFICRGLFCLALAILLPYFSHNVSACMSLISRDTVSIDINDRS